MFRAMAVVGKVTYYCERLNMGSPPHIRQGLIFATSVNPIDIRFVNSIHVWVLDCQYYSKQRL
jgi:hypothetical protein